MLCENGVRCGFGVLAGVIGNGIDVVNGDSAGIAFFAVSAQILRIIKCPIATRNGTGEDTDTAAVPALDSDDGAVRERHRHAGLVDTALMGDERGLELERRAADSADEGHRLGLMPKILTQHTTPLSQ